MVTNTYKHNPHRAKFSQTPGERLASVVPRWWGLSVQWGGVPALGGGGGGQAIGAGLGGLETRGGPNRQVEEGGLGV